MSSFIKALGLVCAAFAAFAVSDVAVAQTLEESVLARIDKLERENAALEKENVALRGRVNRLENSKTARTNPISAPADYRAPPAAASAVAEFSDDRGSPNWHPRFEVSASLLYLQPGAGNLEYGTLVTPFPLPTPNWANQSLDPNYSPAFRVGLRYIASDANDVQLNWTHLNAGADGSFTGGATQMAGPPFLIGPGANPYKMGQGDVSFAYDSVKFDAGHTFCAACALDLRVFGGLEMARIGQNLTGAFESFDGSNSSSYTTRSLFTGLGPRLGAKAQYEWSNIQFLGEIAGAALVGRSESSIDFSTSSPVVAGSGIPSPNNQALTSPDATQVVPSIDGRLAVAYAFPPTAYGQFKIEAGYEAAVYFNAINQYSLTQVATPPVVGTVGVFLATETHLQSNFTVQGPYVTASWVY
jgi:hypothetical protein